MRVILGGLAGGLIIFIWGAIGHMATPLGTMGLSTFEEADEPALLGALKAGVKKPGLYYFPGGEMGKMTEAQLKEREAKVKAGPSGLLIVQPSGGEVMTPAMLLTELGSNVLAALLAGLILTRVVGSYWSRVGVLVLVGLVGWVSLSVSYWNWYRFPTDFTAAEAVMEVVGWALAGLAIAAIVKPTVVPAPVRVGAEAVGV